MDLPIKSKQEILEFFENHSEEFIHFSNERVPEKILDRVKWYYFWEGDRRKGSFLRYATSFAVKLQRMLGINRLKNTDITFQYGSNWFSITHEFAKYVVMKKAWIEEHFRYGYCTDEMFLQTLVINSDFRTNLLEDAFSGDYINCLRYIDWQRGTPYVFKLTDFKDLIDSPFLFARKFDVGVDASIVKRIEEYFTENV